MAWAEEAAPHLPRTADEPWLERFDVEHDNIRAALDWSLASADGARARSATRRGCRDLLETPRISARGTHAPDCRAALEGAERPTTARARALEQLALFKFFESDYESVRALVNESLAIWRSRGSDGRLGLAWGTELLAEVDAETGNYGKALSLFEEALVLFREVQDPTGTADTVKMMGWTAMRSGDYETAARHLSEGLELCRHNGDRHHIASALSGLGELAIRRGQLDRADLLLKESLEISRDIGDKWETPIALGSLGWLALRGGDLRSAHAMLVESLEIRAETGDRGGMAWCLEKLAQAAVLQAGHNRAATLFAAAAVLRAPVNSKMDSVDEHEYQAALSAVQKALGEEDFSAAWSEGEQMPLGAVLQLARQGPETTTVRFRHRREGAVWRLDSAGARGGGIDHAR